MDYQWDFGNGQISLDTTPASVIYNPSIFQDTTYFVTLIANNICGTDSLTDSIKVNPIPTSIFSTDLDIKCEPDPFNFIQTSYGNPDNYYWDFGDSTYSISSDSVFQHVYYAGLNDTTYTITLAVSNECGVDTSTHTITVLPNQVYAFFNTNNTSGCVPLSVSFTQFSTTNTFFNWSFGDGNFSSTYSPQHTYTTPGTYITS